MREPLRELLDEAEAADAKPNESFAAVQAKLSPASRFPLFARVASVGVLATIVGLVSGKLTEPPPALSHDATTLRGKSVDDGPDTAALLSMCRTFTDPDGNQLDWARGADACQKVLTADPINVEARKLKKLAEKEMAQKKIFDEAHRLFAAGEEYEAMDEYLKIDSDSYYYRQARSEFRKAMPLAMKHSGELCDAQVDAGDDEKTWLACKKMMDVGYYLGFQTPDEQVQKLAFNDVASRFKRDPWTKRDDYARFVGGDTVSDYAKLRHDAIYKQYADPALAKAVNDFAIDPVTGMQAVQRYISSGGKDVEAAREVYRHMENAQGSHQSGYEAMLQFDLKTAAAEFHVELDQDAKVMPQTPQALESDLSRQTRKDISEAFAKRGKELFDKRRLPDSFAMCEGGGDFQLGNPSVLECYSNLEDKAASLLDQGCDQAKVAAAITRKDSPVHKKAAKYVTDNCH